MPYIKPTASEQLRRQYKATIEQKKALMGYKDTDIARRMGIAIDTLTRRKRQPELTTIRELRNAYSCHIFTAQDICKIIGIPYKDNNEDS